MLALINAFLVLLMGGFKDISSQVLHFEQFKYVRAVPIRKPNIFLPLTWLAKF